MSFLSRSITSKQWSFPLVFKNYSCLSTNSSLVMSKRHMMSTSSSLLTLGENVSASFSTTTTTTTPLTCSRQQTKPLSLTSRSLTSLSTLLRNSNSNNNKTKQATTTLAFNKYNRNNTWFTNNNNNNIMMMMTTMTAMTQTQTRAMSSGSASTIGTGRVLAGGRLLLVSFGVVFTALGSFLVSYFGGPQEDDRAIFQFLNPHIPAEEIPEQLYQDENTVIAHLKRFRDRIRAYIKNFTDPSRPQLLPDMLPPPYDRPYTLVLDLDETLIHSEWDVS